MLYIKNGTVIDPAADVMYRADLQIEDGKIVKIVRRDENKDTQGTQQNAESSRCRMTQQDAVLDATGMLIGPGLIDTHVHFRDPGFTYKEDIETGSAAAKKGGYTGIVLMANTKPAVDNAETLSYVLNKGKETGIRIESCVNVTKQMKGAELTDMEELAEAGAAGFTDDGIPLMSAELVTEAMKRAKALGKPISFHEENPKRIANNGVNAGKASLHFGIGGSPREAEIDLVERDLPLALKTGAECVIQHISSKEAVELVRQAKKQGNNIHAEATPHHFSLTEETVIQKGTLAKMNPPLREEADRLAVIEGLRDGTIDLIATDHAPHSKEEKEKPITEAPSGIIGLETALSLGIRELVDKGYLTYPQLFDRMSSAPARLYGLSGGMIAEGKEADLVLFRPQERWTVENFASKSSNSPFVGEQLPGVIYYTICDGKIVYQRDGGTMDKGKKKVTAQVFFQQEIASGIFDMWLTTDLAQSAAAGQFIGVYPTDKSKLLPRPISICEVDKENSRLRIVYRVAGGGTEEFSSYKTGKKVEILGVLGNGFPVSEGKDKTVVLLGGGIGIPPMLQLAKELKETGAKVCAVLGYRDNQLFLKEDLEKYATVYIATEDGSVGTKGNVLTAVEAEGLHPDVIMACGPMPMLRAIKKFSNEAGCKAYISLEERMACGVGACLGCVCKTKEVDHHSHVNNARICTDGPVFDAEDVEI